LATMSTRPCACSRLSARRPPDHRAPGTVRHGSYCAHDTKLGRDIALKILAGLLVSTSRPDSVRIVRLTVKLTRCASTRARRRRA
jgi:hypothetical protein